MSLTRLDHATYISDRLNLLAAIVKARSRVGLLDANRVLETVSTRFFNALFNWNLKNLNTEKANYPAADLADRERRIAVQVTNEASSRKIGRTLVQALNHDLPQAFDRIIIFFLLPQKPGFPKNFAQRSSGLKIQTWDIADLLKQMLDMENLKVLEYAAEVLDAEMGKLNVPSRARSGINTKTKSPVLLARFKEENGELCIAGKRTPKDHPPAYWIDLWIKDARAETESVRFEILDEAFRDNPWTETRGKGGRDFLTDDMNSWGDVAILLQGRGKGTDRLWFSESTLYQALVRYYGKKPKDPKIERVLKQFLDN